MIGARHAARTLVRRGDPNVISSLSSPANPLPEWGAVASPALGPGQERMVRFSKIGKSRKKCEFLACAHQWP